MQRFSVTQDKGQLKKGQTVELHEDGSANIRSQTGSVQSCSKKFVEANKDVLKEHVRLNEQG